jgi:hypothetical protein
MKALVYTLLADGSSDRALLRLLDWLLVESGVASPLIPQWVDLGRLFLPRHPTLAEKIAIGLDHYPCNLLFVHRDAENAHPVERRREIDLAYAAISDRVSQLPVCVAVIPVRMTEAWFLCDELAIKAAAGNRHYTDSLNLPPLADLEQLSDPKALLHDRLKRASCLRGRRLKNFSVHASAQRVVEFMDDFAPLRSLVAFRSLEDSVRQVVAANNW